MLIDLLNKLILANIIYIKFGSLSISRMSVRFVRKPVIVNLMGNIRQLRVFSNSSFLRSDRVPEEMIPKNILEDHENRQSQPYGKIYDTKPFKMKLEANKKYAWCLCGESKSQPLCDGTHKIHELKITLKPLLFMVGETKEYWLCNCKQTLHRPFCDGTHKRNDIQESRAAKFKVPLK